MAKCYEKYKDSGIAWIGEIPEHWSVKRLNDIGKYRKGPFGSALKVDSFIDKSDDAIKVYEQQNAIKKSAIIGASYISKEYFENNMKGFEVCANDIIVSCAGTIGELFVLPSNIEKGIINQALMRMRMDCRYVNLSFFLYIFDILLRVESEQSSNGSAMKNIPPFDILKKIRIPLANISEQEQIAKYLDWKCGEVDRIVEVRERQIKLLGELRTSVISRAVTHGLNPNAPLKNSGIDWIGQIPKHWETIKLKYIFTFGKGLNITKEDLVESGMPVISYGQIHSKENHGTGVKESLKRFVNGDYLKTNRQSLVNNNDFIFADTSEDLEGVGNCVFVDNNEMLFAGYHTITLKVKNMQHNKYLAYLFLVSPR